MAATTNYKIVYYLFALFAMVGIFSNVAAVPAVSERDVYVPPITYPHQGTVWYRGQTHTVTWNATHPPKHITNPVGQIYLRKGGLTTHHILAKGFKITDGHVKVTVPSVDDGDDYQLVLFGDSGNFSPDFTIHS